jgi:hypothetical protein
MQILKWPLKFLLILWASPYSLIGIVIGALGLLSGGHGRLRDGALEFYGGLTAWLVRHLPTGEFSDGRVYTRHDARSCHYRADWSRLRGLQLSRARACAPVRALGTADGTSLFLGICLAMDARPRCVS